MRIIYFLGFSILFSLIGCKVKRSRLQEAGTIIPAEFKAAFTKEEVQLGVLKVCFDYGIRSCATGFLISEDGVIITASHVSSYGIDSVPDDFDPSSVVENSPKVRIVSGFNHTLDANSDPVEPEILSVDVVMRYRYDVDRMGSSFVPDAAVLKIESPDLDRFRKWGMG